jgi:Sigma-70 region 2
LLRPDTVPETMLRSLKPNPSHEDYFIQRYGWLMGRALQLTKRDSEAEDLVHDAFIQFTLRRPDLAAIENADAYLNRMLRNMYLSSVRRANLIQDFPLSIAEYDSAEIGLRATDPRDQIKVQDELRQILAAEGLIDPNRAGMIGFSRSCFYVMQTLTASTLHLRAASIVDGLTKGTCNICWKLIVPRRISARL